MDFRFSACRRDDLSSQPLMFLARYVREEEDGSRTPLELALTLDQEQTTETLEELFAAFIAGLRKEDGYVIAHTARFNAIPLPADG